MVDFVFLDTETTGLDDDAELVEIAVVDDTGAVLFESYCRPIPPNLVANTIRLMTIREKPNDGSFSEINAARIPIGTTPTPKNNRPISNPTHPHVTNVTAAPRNQVVRPNI